MKSSLHGISWWLCAALLCTSHGALPHSAVEALEESEAGVDDRDGSLHGGISPTGRTHASPGRSLKQLEAVSWCDIMGSGRRGDRKKGKGRRAKYGKKYTHATLERIIEQGKPVLLRDSPATQWPAQQWTWHSLSSRVLYLRHVRTQHSPVFTLRREEVGEEGEEGRVLPPTQPHNVTTLARMPFADFLQPPFTEGGPPFLYYYYTAPLEAWAPSGLGEDVKWTDLAVTDKGVKARNGEATSPPVEGTRNGDATSSPVEGTQEGTQEGEGTQGGGPSRAVLWLSRPGVTAQCHYDKSHNFFTQLIGTKRFTLFPPSALSVLHPYPSLHPSRRQSALSPQEIQALAHQHNATQVTVGPGDVLYLPPFYWHTVETLGGRRTGEPKSFNGSESSNGFECVNESDPSNGSGSSNGSESLDGGLPALSVSVLSPSSLEYTLAQAYWHALPFKDLNGTMERVVGAQAYLVHLLSRARGVGGPSEAARLLYASRYSRLYPQANGNGQGGFTCYEDQPGEVSRIRETRLDRRGIIDTASAVARVINQKHVGKAIRQTWLGDYIEELACWAMGRAEDVPLFITNCLNYESLQIVEEVEGPDVIRLGTSQESDGYYTQ